MRAIALLLLLVAGSSIASEPVVLSVRVNGNDKDAVVFERDGERLSASKEDWEKLGVQLQPGEATNAHLAASDLGITFKIDEETQTVEMDVPADRLPVQVQEDDRITMPTLAPAAPGVLLNYSLAGNKTGSSVALSAGHEVRVAGRWGSVSTSGQINYTTQEGSSYLRGQTVWRYDDYKRLISYEAGDVVANGVQVGGIRIAKDPAVLDPYTPTYPVPVLGGIAVDDGTARILSNGLPVEERPLQRGPFTIERPLSNGMNNTDIVLKDKFGREQHITRSFYVSRDVLKKGGTTWEVAAGAVRRNENYGDPVASARYSRGMTDRFTLTGSTELSKTARNATVEGRVVLPRGVVDVRVSGSTSELGSGSQYGVGYTYQGPVVGLTVQHLQASDNYWQLASRSKKETLVGLNIGRSGSAFQTRVSYVDQDGQKYGEANAFYQRGNHFFQLGARHDLDRRETSVEAGYRYTFNRGSVYASARQAPFQQALRVGGDYSDTFKDNMYRVSATHDRIGESSRTSVRGALDMPRGYATAEISDANGALSVSATYDAAVHIGRSGVQRLKSVSDGYAVVRVAGVADIPVQVNNRTIGKTNAKGEIVVGGMPALSATKISLDQRALPVGVSIEDPELFIAPRRMTGSLAQFKVLGLNALTFTVKREKPIEPGALAKSEDLEVQVGFDGQLFLEQPVAGQKFQITDEHGTCSIELPKVLPKMEDDNILQCK